jgi:hypothetical protein
MNCSNKSISERLPWYLTDRLSEKERKEVENHLGVCQKCRDDLNEMKWLSRSIKNASEGLYTEHILSEQLVLYAESQSELDTDDLTFIEDHLAECKDCQQELELLKKVNGSLQAGRKKSPIRTISQWLIDILPEFAFKPAFAYIIILLLLYPAWLGIFRWPKGKIPEPRMVQNNYELPPFDTRAEMTEEDEINIPSQARIFSLSFNIPILSSEHIRYDAVIVDAQKKIIWRKNNIESLDEYGTFLLICDGKFFKVGAYSLIVEEINLELDQRQNEFVFPFKRVES